MSEHTPGPWQEWCGTIYGPELGAIHSGKTCLECGHSPNECGPAIFNILNQEILDDAKNGLWDGVVAPKVADLRLAASAPDLLENLQGCMEALASYAPDCIEVSSARAAIAKALGEGE